MSVFQGDFLGFTLGTTHSSQLNITRISSGDRYDDILIPSFKDTTAEVPGGDGTYYWDTFYNQRTFTLNFAYDDLRDEDLRALRKLFSFKGIQQLIFDETPYKKYLVKCQSPPVFKYICFDNMETRVYKGEGSVNLIAYYPYALGTTTTIMSGESTYSFNNVGDLEGQLKIIYSPSDDGHFFRRKFTLFDNKNNIIKYFEIKETPIVTDKFLLIDNTTHLIEGLDDNQKKTGNLYNKYIDSGDFFNIPVGASILQCRTSSNRLTGFSVNFTPVYY